MNRWIEEVGMIEAIVIFDRIDCDIIKAMVLAGVKSAKQREKIALTEVRMSS
jgi:hypothetical protein